MSTDKKTGGKAQETVKKSSGQSSSKNTTPGKAAAGSKAQSGSNKK